MLIITGSVNNKVIITDNKINKNEWKLMIWRNMNKKQTYNKMKEKDEQTTRTPTTTISSHKINNIKQKRK